MFRGPCYHKVVRSIGLFHSVASFPKSYLAGCKVPKCPTALTTHSFLSAGAREMVSAFHNYRSANRSAECGRDVGTEGERNDLVRNADDSLEGSRHQNFQTDLHTVQVSAVGGGGI